MTNDDEYEKGKESVTVGVIRNLIDRVTEFEEHNKHDRAQMRHAWESSIVQLRKDFHTALSPLQLDNIDHRKTHEADRMERVQRQAENDKNLYALRIALWILAGLVAGMILLLLIAIVFVVVKEYGTHG